MGSGTTWEGVKSAWPIYLWGGGLTALVCILTSNERKLNKDAEEIIIVGTITSVLAGVLEEISFRWWIFCGLLGWIMIHIPIPIASFFTLGKLDTLFYGFGWFVGAAILGSNGQFRNGHAYQGFFGYINSWFIGLFMFWLMFNYGLLSAVIAHWFYDQLIFTIRYIDACFERKMGW